MYINIKTVDRLMKSALLKKSFLNQKSCKELSPSRFILEKGAAEMLENLKARDKVSAILEMAGSDMLNHIEKKYSIQ